MGAYDDADGFNYRFIDEMGTFPTDVELTLTKADGTPLTDADCDIWAFGYQGQIQFVDDTIRAWTESPLEDSQNMTVMVALHKGVLHPERTEEGSFETVKERAFGGSDYEDEPLTAKDIFYAILGVVLLCAVVAAVILIARRIHKAKLARLRAARAMKTRSTPSWRRPPGLTASSSPENWPSSASATMSPCPGF